MRGSACNRLRCFHLVASTPARCESCKLLNHKRSKAWVSLRVSSLVETQTGHSEQEPREREAWRGQRPERIKEEERLEEREDKASLLQDSE